MKILIIDDSQVMRNIHNVLTENKVDPDRFLEADTGRKALNLAGQGAFRVSVSLKDMGR